MVLYTHKLYTYTVLFKGCIKNDAWQPAPFPYYFEAAFPCQCLAGLPAPLLFQTQLRVQLLCLSLSPDTCSHQDSAGLRPQGRVDSREAACPGKWVAGHWQDPPVHQALPLFPHNRSSRMRAGFSPSCHLRPPCPIASPPQEAMDACRIPRKPSRPSKWVKQARVV